MSAATADRDTELSGTSRRSLPIAGAAIIFAGCLVCLDTDGYCVAGSDTSGYRFVGVAAEAFDNSGSSTDAVDENGEDAYLEVLTDTVIEMTGSGFAVDDINKPVYLIDDQTVGLSGNASVDYHIYVGRIVEYISATSVRVKIDPYGDDPNLVDGVLDVAGVNAGAVSLANHSFATGRGGTGIYLKQVDTVSAFVASSGNAATPVRKVATTHWTLTAGVLSTVGDESLNRLVISFRGVIKQS